MNEVVETDLSLRRMFCDFLCVSLLVVLARSEDVIEAQLQHYLNVRKHANDFRKEAHSHLEKFEGGAKDDLEKKYATLLSFDFEAAARLKAWDDLGQIIDECNVYGTNGTFELIADILLCSQAPESTMTLILRKIIHACARLQEMDNAKLSRWIRCLFQIALPSNLNIAEQVLNQVILICESPSKANSSQYPTDELEWLATTTFNRAVDFYCASDDQACKRWAEKALIIAGLIRENDGSRPGGLRDLLESKYLSLSWTNT
ncbi:MAG: hypothetical protein M1816_002278 [Peltula sp. TS41687]|nr:MAG: hypothetical protein M1816_002278 [Peltula sp. TS41687]